MRLDKNDNPNGIENEIDSAKASAKASASARDIIEQLGLEQHVEGGWFLETYRAAAQVDCPEREGGSRSALTTIHYLLEASSPRGQLHLNQSSIVHFYEGGGLLRYVMVAPDGRLSEALLGPGYERQLIVPGGVWKASELIAGDWGLVGEAVSPGFDYRDWALATRAEIEARFPQHMERLAPFLRG